jgi:hypothetical protein
MTRWPKVTLIVDSIFFLLMGISSWVFDRQSYSEGSGPFGDALRGSPHVLGFVEAHMLVAVIGLGLLAAAFTGPSATWQVFAIVAHISLASVDLGYRDQADQLGGVSGTLPVIVSIHAVLIVAHIVGITRARTSSPARVPPAR